jgi:hypothetical protein
MQVHPATSRQDVAEAPEGSGQGLEAMKGGFGVVLQGEQRELPAVGADVYHRSEGVLERHLLVLDSRRDAFQKRSAEAPAAKEPEQLAAFP